MKYLITAFAASFLFIATASQAYTYRCTELVDAKKDTANKARMSVVIKELENITDKVDFGKHFDSVYRVNVKINKTLDGKKTNVKTFNAIQTNEDVVYTISAVKSQGVKIMMFADEADDAWMEMTYPSGAKKTFNLHCE